MDNRHPFINSFRLDIFILGVYFFLFFLYLKGSSILSQKEFLTPAKIALPIAVLSILDGLVIVILLISD